MPSSRLSKIMVLFALFIFLVLILLVWPFTADDAFIIFRYAANLAQGAGPTFNPGMPPVEGYTTFLWMLLLSLPHWLGLNAVIFAKVVGVLALVAAMWVAYAFVRLLARLAGQEGAESAAAVAPLLIAAFPASAIHAISGMETALFALFVTLFLYRLTLFADEPNSRNTVLLALASLMVGLTRPEGNLVALVGLCAVFFVISRERRAAFAGLTGLCYVLPGAIYFAWRSIYYGHLLPLPFYVKVITPVPFAGRHEVATLGFYLIVHVGILALLALRELDVKWLPALLAAISLPLFFTIPVHEMGYDWRYLFPVVPFVLVIAALGAGTLFDWMRSLPEPRYILMQIGIVVILSVGMLTETHRRIGMQLEYARGLREVHIALGERLSTFESSPPPVLAIGDTGAVPYYSGWRVVDTCGLNDPYIALTGDHDPAYVFDQNPDLVVLNSADGDTFLPISTWDADLYAACQEVGMIPLKTLNFDNRYHLWLMAMTNSPVANLIREW